MKNMNKPSFVYFEAKSHYDFNINTYTKLTLKKRLDTYGKSNKWYRKVITLYNRI